jgi:RHS repeat-associated protein
MQAWSYSGEAVALPKTRVWGSKPKNVHSSSASGPLKIELRWECEESSREKASGSGVTFKYDPFGRRIEKVSPNATSIFAYDADNLIETVNGSGSLVARYTQTQNVDEPLAMQRGTSTDYYQADGLGSVTSLSSSTGTLAQTYTYDSFGNTTNSSGSLTNFFRYVARDFDTETNLYYYRARYYDPNAGRFLSEDPMRFTTGINFYRYVKNNATNLADPYGLKVQECCRNTQVNWWVDFLSQLTGIQHCFIKTSTVTAGMGPANGGPLPTCPLFTQTAITDHSGETISPGECKDVPGVDEACVDKSLKIGTPTGRWTPTNQCNSFASDVLDKCSTCPLKKLVQYYNDSK